MRKILIVLALIFTLTLFFNFAPRGYAENQYWHSKDNYAVELDGEGDAFVVANLNFESISQKNVSSITLEIPGTRIDIYKVVQSQYYYTRYYPAHPEYKSGATFLNYSLERLSASTKITLPLEYELEPNSETGIFIIYKTNDMAKKTSRGLKFKFETIKDPNALIRYVGASIRVPENMKLKGKGSFEINYMPSSIAQEAMAGKSASTLGESLRSLYYISPQYSARNLDPGESFTITGLYGKSTFLLYLWEIISGGIAFIVVLVLSIVFIIIKKPQKTLKTFKTREKKEKPKEKEGFKQGFSFGRGILAGLLSGFLTTLTLFLIYWLFNLVSHISYNIRSLVGLFLFLISILLIGITLLGPSYYMKKNYGLGEGIFTLLMSIVFSLVFLFAVLFIFFGSPGYQGYYYGVKPLEIIK